MGKSPTAPGLARKIWRTGCGGAHRTFRVGWQFVAVMLVTLTVTDLGRHSVPLNIPMVGTAMAQPAVYVLSSGADAVALSLDVTTATEGGTPPGALTITATVQLADTSGTTAEDWTVSVSVDTFRSRAEAGDDMDYVLAGTAPFTTTIAAGAEHGDTATITLGSLTINDDSIVEADETIVFGGQVTDGTNRLWAVRVTPAIFTVTDDAMDSVEVSAQAVNASVAEGANAEFDVAVGARVEADFIVNWEINFAASGVERTDFAAATATAGQLVFGTPVATTDSKRITIAVLDDMFSESAESITLTLTVAGAGVANSVESRIGIATGPATASVAASDPLTVTLSGPSEVYEGHTADYTATIAGGVSVTNMLVELNISSTAPTTPAVAADVTTTLPLEITIPAGGTSTTGTLTIATDATDEMGAEVLALEISGISGHSGTATAGTPARVETSIQEGVTVSLALDKSTVQELATPEVITGTVSFSGGTVTTTDDIVFNWILNFDGLSASATDFFGIGGVGGQAVTGSVTFAGGDTTTDQTFEVKVPNDNHAEADEQFNIVLTLATASLADTITVGSSGTQTVTIQANDALTVSLSGPSTAREGDTVEYTVTANQSGLTHSQADVIVVLDLASDSAGDAADIKESLPLTLTLPYGSLPRTIRQSVTFDLNPDGATELTTEAFKLEIASARMGGTAQTIGTSGSATTTVSNVPRTLDFTGDGIVTEADATFLWVINVFSFLVGTGESLSGADDEHRRNLLGPLVSGSWNDDRLRELIRETRQQFVSSHADLTGDGRVDATDAQVLYVALALESLVGDGSPGSGIVARRRTAISGLLPRHRRDDADLRQTIRDTRAAVAQYGGTGTFSSGGSNWTVELLTKPLGAEPTGYGEINTVSPAAATRDREVVLTEPWERAVDRDSLPEKLRVGLYYKIESDRSVAREGMHPELDQGDYPGGFMVSDVLLGIDRAVAGVWFEGTGSQGALNDFISATTLGLDAAISNRSEPGIAKNASALWFSALSGLTTVAGRPVFHVTFNESEQLASPFEGVWCKVESGASSCEVFVGVLEIPLSGFPADVDTVTVRWGGSDDVDRDLITEFKAWNNRAAITSVTAPPAQQAEYIFCSMAAGDCPTEIPQVHLALASGGVNALTEASGGTTAATFEVSLARAVDAVVKVDWSLTPGATQPTVVTDFTAATGTVEIPAGQTGPIQFTVTVNDDNLAEATENFMVTIGIASDSVAVADTDVELGTSSVAMTIADNDALALELVGPEDVLEGADATYTVRVVGTTVPTADLTVDVAVTPGTVRPVIVATDLGTIPATATIASGATMGTLTIPTIEEWPDVIDPGETFTVTISNPAGGGGTGTPTVSTASVTTTLLEASIDLNRDQTVNAADALLLYYSLEFSELVGDGSDSTGFANLRGALLANLGPEGSDDPIMDDGDLRRLVTRAQRWRRQGATMGGDIDENGSVNSSDALILYYAIGLQTELGDGTAGQGDEDLRQTFLGGYSTDTGDVALRGLLTRARELLP